MPTNNWSAVCRRDLAGHLTTAQGVACGCELHQGIGNYSSLGMIGTCELQAREEGGEVNKGEHMEEGIGAPGACYVGEHVVVHALGGDGPLFVVAVFFYYR